MTLTQYLQEDTVQSITKTELGKADEPGTTVHGVHYSHTAGLKELHGSRWGTGIKGAEQSRLEYEQDPRIKDRVYFYNRKSDTDLPIAESGLGPHVHSTMLHGIYDAMKASPEEKSAFNAEKKKHLPDMYQEDDLATAFEKAVLARNYNGYTNGKVTVVLGKNSVPTTYEGPSWQLKQAA